jgi:hypothetical protein
MELTPLQNAFVKSETLTLSPKLYTSINWQWHKFYNDFGLAQDWAAPSGFYGVAIDTQGDAWLWTKPLFQHNGANLYPDWDFILEPSRVHDCLHWLIMHGVILVTYNDLIDKELGDCVRYGKTPIAWWQGGELTRKARALAVEVMTRLVDEKARLRAEHVIKTVTI